VNDINKERRIIKSDLVPSTPPMSQAQRDYNATPKSQTIKQPAGVPGGPYGGSKDPRRND
jgi:hypothetical protein